MNVRLASILWLASSVSAADFAGTPEARAAKFYAAGLERPLLRLRTGATLVDSCVGRLRRACSAEQRKLAADGRTIALLDELTLFPQRLTEDPTSAITKPAQLEIAIRAASTALLREAYEYDRQLFARYGAALRACPDEDSATYRESLDEIVRINLTGFQALAGDDLDETKAAMGREESALAESLREAAVTDCVALRKSGEYLMQLMHSKLQPWSGEDRRVADETPAFEFGSQAPKPGGASADPAVTNAVAGNFILVVATELQLTVFPETEASIEAITGTVGKDD